MKGPYQKYYEKRPGKPPSECKGDYHTDPVVKSRVRDATQAWVKTFQCEGCGEVYTKRDRVTRVV